MKPEVTVERWGGNAPDADPRRRRVLVLPGARYGAQLPGLHWPLRALALQGWQVWAASWDLSAIPGRAERRVIVETAIDLAIDEMAGDPHLIVAKSAGTLAAGWAADHSVPAVWTTPLLDDEECVGHIARASAPALLVAGSRDHTWDDTGAERAGKRVARIEGADHGWETGDWRTELDALRQLTCAVEDFATGLDA